VFQPVQDLQDQLVLILEVPQDGRDFGLGGDIRVYAE